MTQSATQELSLGGILESLGLEQGVAAWPLSFDALAENPRLSREERLQVALATLVASADPEPDFSQDFYGLIWQLNHLITWQLSEILHAPAFQRLEADWRSIEDLVENTDFNAKVDISLLDIDKAEAHKDLEGNEAEMAGSEIFKRVYTAEFDQYGGAPYGVIIGLYEFDNQAADLAWLARMGAIAAAAHCPFLSAVSPRFFGLESMNELLAQAAWDFDSPRYDGWNALRELPQAAYLGLTMPRYLVRPPHDEDWPGDFREQIASPDDYLWGNAAMLLAQVIIRFADRNQQIRQLHGSPHGHLLDLARHLDPQGGHERQGSTEVLLPLDKEAALSRAGLIPLVGQPYSGAALFFHVPSLQKAPVFDNPEDTTLAEGSARLSYTLATSRIAHYLKCIVRDCIENAANLDEIQGQIDRWVLGYVTTVVNPDDLTLRYYPFKAYNLEMEAIEGHVGWYHCKLSIVPHVLFEGLDVDFRVETRLG